MCPRELVEKDGACKRAKDKQRRSSGPRSFLRGKEREITVDGSSLTVVPLNMRCRRPRVLRLFSSSSLFLFSFFLSCPVLSLSLSLSLSLTSRYRSRLLSTRNRRILEPISFTRSTRHYQTGCCSCNIVPRFSHALLELLALLASMEIDLR